MHVTPNEMAEARRWLAAHLETADTAAIPFSFTYGGQPSAALLKTWTRRWTSRKLDDQRQEHTLTYTDPKTHLAVRCVIVEYLDFPTLEWTLYFQNTGTANTPILAAIQALDTHLPPPAQGEYVLHHHYGSPCAICDFQPLESSWGYYAKNRNLHPTKRITTYGGRPSNSDFPFFNIASDGQGVIAVIGWPGQWAAEFTREKDRSLRIQAGQELTHFRLHPGEEVRGPLIVLQFWQGDRVRSQNIWRRWMLAHNVPRPGGKPLGPQVAAGSSVQFNEMINANEENQNLFIDRYVEEGLKIEYWFMDAGWYVNDGTWPNTGTWEVDKKRFPRGLRAVSDHAHARGINIMVWFEPERVTPGTWLYENRREWLLAPSEQPDRANGRNNYLLNLGNPDALRWVIETMDRLITEEGVDLYRQDFNMEPLDYWRANDAEDRQGITEIYHVMGYLTYWDELIRRHPNMLLDTCASGGRRLDLETLRRSIPVLRSDYVLRPVGNQCHTYGLASWLPFYGTGALEIEPYMYRSTYCPHFTIGPDMRDRALNYDLMRRLMAEWRYEIAPNYWGDYYPLTSYSLENDAWMAWQFDRPEAGQGMVQVFRREESPYDSAQFRLHGLDADAQYTVTDLDTRQPQQMSGHVLMEQGLAVTIDRRPAALVFTYKKSA